MTREELYERRKEMAEQVRRGKSLGEVARDFRVSLQTVSRACMEQGVLPLMRREEHKGAA